jgi:tetratricopeptide (TPR) repeat protein
MPAHSNNHVRWRAGARLLGVLLSLALLAPPATAWARPSDEKQAQQLYNQGRRAYRDQDYERAAQAFEAASRLSSDPIYLYNLAQARRKQGRLQDAVTAFEGYLKAAPDAPNRAAVQRTLSELRGQLPPVPAPTPVAPEPTPPTPAPAPTPAPVAETSPGRPALFWVGLGGMIAGVALLGGGIGVGVQANNIASDLSKGSGQWSSTRQNQFSDGQTKANTAYALYGVGAALAVGGVILMVVKRSPSSESRVAFRLTPLLGGARAEIDF